MGQVNDAEVTLKSLALDAWDELENDIRQTLQCRVAKRDVIGAVFINLAQTSSFERTTPEVQSFWYSLDTNGKYRVVSSAFANHIGQGKYYIYDRSTIRLRPCINNTRANRLTGSRL